MYLPTEARRCALLTSVLIVSLLAFGQAPLGTPSPSAAPELVQGVLTEPGGQPFHLKAAITDHDSDDKGEVEIFWASPDKWRRTIQSEDFSQTLVVNGDKIFEQDSEGYFPLALQTLVSAMTDPRPTLAALRPSDQIYTKANGASDESGRMCFDPTGRICGVGTHGLSEQVNAPGHSVNFTDYRKFHDKRIARLLLYGTRQAKVEKLEDLKEQDSALFRADQPTAKADQIRTIILPEPDLRALAVDAPGIVWPQVLDGATKGPASYYVSIDREGHVRETVVLNSANERANDSARRQIMKWKFKPITKDGAPSQVESILNFTLDTRASGPSSPLSNEEARKLASNIVEPSFSKGTPKGFTLTVSVAIDEQGDRIEAIPADGPPGHFQECYEALKKMAFQSGYAKRSATPIPRSDRL